MSLSQDRASAKPQNAKGRLTSLVAEALARMLCQNRGCEVYCNHEIKGKKRAYTKAGLAMRTLWKGEAVPLGHADKVVLQDRIVRAVAEIEDTTSRPRTILGDLDAYTRVEEIALPGKSATRVTEAATRIVLFPRIAGGARSRLDFLTYHATNLIQPSPSEGKAVPTCVCDFVYLRNDVQAPGTPGEIRKARVLARRIRRMAGL